MGLGFKCLTFKFAHMHLRLLWSRLKVPLQISQRSFSGGQIWWWCRFQAGLSVFPEDWNLSDCRRQVLKSYRGMKKKNLHLCDFIWFLLFILLSGLFFCSFQTATYVLKSSSGTNTRQQMLTFIKRWRRCRVSRRGYRRGPLLCPVLWKSWHPEPGGRYSSPAYGTRNG